MAHITADFIKETSTTTGVGALTVAGATTAHATFASVMAVGDTCFCTTLAVDAGGTPTGERECGLYTYSAANTLTRTDVKSSSNAGAAVSFSAGTKHVFISQPAHQVAWARERLTAARTYYVRTDGSDANTGLANTAGGAFLTIQRAVDVISETLDLSSFVAPTQCGAATRTAVVLLKPFVASGGSVSIIGDETTPANCTQSVASNHCFNASERAGPYLLAGFKFTTSTSGVGIRAAALNAIVNYRNIDFGACASGHIAISYLSAVTAVGNYSISGSAPYHFGLFSGLFFCASRTVTLTGTPAFSSAFAVGQGVAQASISGNTFTGSATGKRYDAQLGCLLNSGGGGATYLPGDTAGTYATGGQYA